MNTLCALFLVSVGLTLLHTIQQEVWGKGGPFWEYAEPITGVRLSWFVGFALFVGLAAILIALAVAGYLFGSVFFLSVLIGARVGDALVSHGLLAVAFRRPNPGLSSSVLYLAEAVAVACLFKLDAVGCHVGFGAFAGFWLIALVRTWLGRDTKPH